MYQITDYQELKHYKDRKIGWCKLSANILKDNNYAFSKLSDKLKLDYICCLIIATKNDGAIDSSEQVRFECNLENKPDIDSLLEKNLLTLITQKQEKND